VRSRRKSDKALRCAALRCAALCCAVLCCAVLCCAALRCAVLCCAPHHVEAVERRKARGTRALVLAARIGSAQNSAQRREPVGAVHEAALDSAAPRGRNEAAAYEPHDSRAALKEGPLSTA